MTGELNSHDRPQFNHHILHIGMTAFAADGPSLQTAHEPIQVHGTFQINDDRLPASKSQGAFQQDHSQVLGSNDSALIIHHCNSIPVTVKCDPQTSPELSHSRHQGRQMLRNRAIRVALRKSAVQMVVQGNHIRPKFSEYLGGHTGLTACPRVQYNRQALDATSAKAFDHLRFVSSQRLGPGRDSPPPGRGDSIIYRLFFGQGPDHVRGRRSCPVHHLKSIELRGIVGGGDDGRGLGLDSFLGPVDHRGRYDTKIGNSQVVGRQPG